MVELPYGRTPYPLDLAGREYTLVLPTALPAPQPLRSLLDSALDAPIGRPRLEAMAAAGARATLIISDPSRAEPRAQLIAAVQERLPAVRWTLAIATGTHGPCNLDELGVPAEVLASASVVNHDGHADADLVDLGVTPRGTPVRVHRCLVDTDLVIATGCVRPHYFAGFGAGVKAIFPGLGEARAIRINHALKTQPDARAGVVDKNPCRADLENAFALLKTPTFLLNGVCAPDNLVHAAVAGDPIDAFRAGASLARAWFSARAPRAPLVIASDALPVTASLYQAAKIAAAVAPLVTEGGTIAIAAECCDGVGPLEVVNEAILRIGVLPRLPAGVRLRLVSGLDPAVVSTTLVEYAPSLSDVLAESTGAVTVVPRASQLLFEAV
ncbi:MAG: lactate racemase domain-containing protein [Kofleriaceae bacterium]